jgi:hypothetical protein
VRLMFAMLCLLCAASIMSPQSLSESRAGDFVFQMPADWHSINRNSKTYLVPNASTDSTTYIELGAHDTGDDSLLNGFNSEVATIERDYRVLTRGQIASQHSPNGFDYYTTTEVLSNRDGKQWVAAIMGARNGNRLESVLFMTCESKDQLRDAYLNAYRKFLGTIRFLPPQTNQFLQQAKPWTGNEELSNSGRPIERDMSAPPSGPLSADQLPTTPGKFNGIFRALVKEGASISASPNPPTSTANTPNYRFLVLFSDGSALRGLPDVGLSAMKASVRGDVSHGGDSAARWGMYRMRGNRGSVVFANPAAGRQLVTGQWGGDRWEIQENGDRLEVNGDTYIMLDGGIPGQKLMGVYKPLGDRKKPGITFTRDGRFEDEGILAVIASTPAGIGREESTGGSPSPGRGEYSIGEYTLVLNYSNGHRPPLLFWVDPRTPSAQNIYLGNVKFQRVQ